MADQRFALIIANNEYEDQGLQNLVAPLQDAQALEEVLSDPAIGNFQQVDALLNRPSHEVRNAIERFFKNRQTSDVLLLYFSGHGVKSDNGKLYFASSDTQSEILRSTSIEAQLVNEIMQESRSRSQILLLDCCYSGAFAKGMFKADEKVNTEDFFGKWKGRVILTASDSVQYSFDGNQEKAYSVFTRYLVRGLKTGDADANKDGSISIDELYDYIYENVTRVKPQQTPRKWVVDAEGKIIIAKSPKPIIDDCIKLHFSFHEYDEAIQRISWSPNGSKLAFAFGDQTVRLLDSVSGTVLLTLEEPSDKYLCVAWSPDSKKLAASGESGKIPIWDIETRNLIQTYQASSETAIVALAWSPDGQTLAAGIESGEIEIWDTNTHQSTIWNNHTAWVDSLAWSPNGAILASGAEDGTINLWNKESGSLIHTLKEHSMAVRGVSWSPCEKFLASSSDDQTIRLWNLETFTEIQRLDARQHPIKSVSFSYNGQFLASNSETEIQIWKCNCSIDGSDHNFLQAAAVIKIPSPSGWVPNAAFHPNLPTLAASTGIASTLLQVWNLNFDKLQNQTQVKIIED